MTTFSELKTLFANKYGEESAPSTGAETRNRFINLAGKNILSRKKWNWRKKTGTGTTSGTASFTLASDFCDEGFVRDTFTIDGQLWTQIIEGEQRLYPPEASIFYVIGNDAEGYQAVFPNGAPIAGLPVSYRYHRGWTTLVSDLDVCIVPNCDAIASMAVGMFIQSEGDNAEAIPFLDSAENDIAQMERIDIRSNPRKIFRNRDDHYGTRTNSFKDMY
jgi:hypothetical protein